MTVQFSGQPETPVFESDVVSPDSVYATLLIAEQTARATAAATNSGPVCIREYVGPTLVATLHGKEDDNDRYAQFTPIQFVQIRNRNSGKVLDVCELSTANGTPIHQWEYSNGFNQQWQLALTAGEYCTIVNRHSGKVVEVPGHTAHDATTIQQWEYAGGENQQWRMVALGNGYFSFENKLTGKVLEVNESSKGDGALIQQREYRDRDSQQWQVTRIGQPRKGI